MLFLKILPDFVAMHNLLNSIWLQIIVPLYLIYSNQILNFTNLFLFYSLNIWFQDYLKAPAATDLAYNAILEHTIAERERR